MKKTSKIERAVRGESRLATATKSLMAWRRFESDRLRAERRLFREEIEARKSRGEEDGDILQALAENKMEQSELDRRWENSSLRSRLDHGMAETGTVSPGIEKRIAGGATVPGLDMHDRQSRASSGRVTLIGYGATFNSLSEDLGFWRERISPGAFTNVLKTCDCRLLQNHESNHLLARTKSKTLRLYQDSHGLKFYGDLIRDDPLSEAVTERVVRGDITGCSFAFIVGRDRWELAKKRGETDIRVIEIVDQLYDVGPCTYPAYPSTTVTVEHKSNGRADEPISTALAEKELERYEPELKVRRLPFDVRHQIKTDYEYAGRLMQRNNELFPPMTATQVQAELVKIRRGLKRERTMAATTLPEKRSSSSKGTCSLPEGIDKRRGLFFCRGPDG